MQMTLWICLAKICKSNKKLRIEEKKQFPKIESKKPCEQLQRTTDDEKMRIADPAELNLIRTPSFNSYLNCKINWWKIKRFIKME